MRVNIAEFEFDDFCVRFAGPNILASRMEDNRWIRLGMIPNEWKSDREDDGGVMCRKYKPRIKDAMRALKVIQEQGSTNA